MSASIAGWAGRIARALGLTDPSPGRAVQTSVAEITPCTGRRSNGGSPRLNLVLPSINAQHYFGGIHTAVQLYRELCRYFPRSRIILLDSAPDEAAARRFDDHALVRCDQDPVAPRQIVAFNDRYERTLPVQSGDIWLATAWWTAYAAQRLATLQRSEFGSEGRVACLVQDFEPGFYAWSSQSALAASTYRPSKDIAVFNTRLLADYFRMQGLDFKQQLVFEPTINDALREKLAIARDKIEPRRRRIVVYGRPSTSRNAFELICESLRCWGWSDPRSKDWEVVAPGELLEDINLGPVTMRALGKLDLDRYAELLSTSAVGVSLMVSPHPSYPPLEMAAFGMGVLTNNFANKDLTAFSPNIRCLGDLSPEAIATSLSRECESWETRRMIPGAVMECGHPFLADTDLAALAKKLAAIIKD